MQGKFDFSALIEFATTLLNRAGLDSDKAAIVAGILVEGDLLGHDTHGLALLPKYLSELSTGKMRKSGGPECIADYPSVVTWDGLYLPGPWLTS